MQTGSKINHKGIAVLYVALLGVVLAFMLAGCGSGGSGSASTSAASASASASAATESASESASASASEAASSASSSGSASASESTSTVRYASLEDFLSTEQGMDQLRNTVKTDAFEQFGTVDIAVSGDDLLYTATTREALDKDPVTDESFSGDAVKAIATGIANLEKEVGVEDVTIQFIVRDPAGKEWHTVIFDNQGMVK